MMKKAKKRFYNYLKEEEDALDFVKTNQNIEAM